MNKALDEINNTGTFIKIKNKKFGEIFEEFITKEAPLTRKDTTINTLNNIYNGNLKEPFEDMYIHQIRPTDIQRFYIECLKTLAHSYVICIHSLLQMIFEYSIKMEYIKSNIMDKVTKPKKKKTQPKIQVFSKEELSWMNENFNDTKFMTPFMLGIHLGARASEVYGLRWSDFDFNNNTVTINKQLQYINKKWVLSTLKTKKSYRTIAFSNTLKQYLLNEQDRQSTLKIKPFELLIDTGRTLKEVVVFDFVNKDNTGRKLTTNSNNIAIKRKCKAEGNFMFKFHNLRHTHATMLLEQGLNPKYIQERLGHSTLDFTLRLYTHVTKNMDLKAIEISVKVFKF